MNLGSIREYAQKTTEIISTVADMQVLVCDMQFQIIGDSKDGITNQRALNKLTGNSMLVETVRLRRQQEGFCRMQKLSGEECVRR